MKGALFLGMSLIFVAAGIIMVRDPSVDRIKAWGAVLFFGLCAAVFFWMLVRPMKLALDHDGFTLSGGLMRKQEQTRWQDVQGFFLLRMPRGVRTVGFNFEPAARQGSLLHNVNRAVGAEASLPPGWPGSAQEMADDLNAYRMRALGLV